jgi:hypothetical protein
MTLKTGHETTTLTTIIGLPPFLLTPSEVPHLSGPGTPVHDKRAIRKTVKINTRRIAKLTKRKKEL